MVITPQMNLMQPTIAVDSGLTWEQSFNANMAILDAHNHSPGFGTQIQPSGLDINADLSFQNNNATVLRSARFSVQAALLDDATDLGCLYVSGVDLYYNDVNGNPVRITALGTVAGSAGTITGLPSGTASAAYNSISGTFVFQSATNTSAMLDGGSILIRNATPNSNAVTLSAPNALASNYDLVLPTIPGALSFMTLDTNGNISTGPAIAAGITTSNIAAATILGSNIAARTITKGNIALPTIAQSSVAGYTGSPFGTPTLLSQYDVTLSNTTGRPVQVNFFGANSVSSVGLTLFAQSSTLPLGEQVTITVVRDGTYSSGTTVGSASFRFDGIFNLPSGPTNPEFLFGSNVFSFLDTSMIGITGSHTYHIYVETFESSSNVLSLSGMRSMIYEID